MRSPPQLPGAPDGRALLGRDAELRLIDSTVQSARNGRGGALLFVGEPGIGKTTVLAAATADPSTVRVLRVDGFEAEVTMPFAAVQRLATPLRGWLPRLPERHRQALLVAAGVADGLPPDRFLVGLGVLGLLAAAGEAQPVVCVVDDAHLLDAESLDVLAFVARRLRAEAVALLFAARPGEVVDTRLRGVDRVQLTGLPTTAALQLLRSAVPEPLDPATAARVVAATGGNPLAIVDLAGELSVRELMESGVADEPFPVGRHLETHYLQQMLLLPTEVQRWMLIAAADSTGNIDLILGAADRLGIPRSVADDAEQAGFIDLHGAVTFRHPLVGAAAYNGAAGPRRRQVHRALAAAAAESGMVESEAWHSAKATLGTDLAVARRLETVADLAGRRGGLSSRAGVLIQAAALTPDGRDKNSRLVAAAEAALGSGAAQLARTLLDDVDEGALDAVSRGRMTVVRAQHAIFAADPALTRAGADLLAAAAHFRGLDPDLELSTLLQAFFGTLPAERSAEGVTVAELGHRLQEGAGRHTGVGALVLEALGAYILLRYAEAVPVMRRAVDAIGDLPPSQLLRFGLVSVV